MHCDAASARWIPLTDWVGQKDWNLLGIESLATDPVDPNRLYLAAVQPGDVSVVLHERQAFGGHSYWKWLDLRCPDRLNTGE